MWNNNLRANVPPYPYMGTGVPPANTSPYLPPTSNMAAPGHGQGLPPPPALHQTTMIPPYGAGPVGPFTSPAYSAASSYAGALGLSTSSMGDTPPASITSSMSSLQQVAPPCPDVTLALEQPVFPPPAAQTPYQPPAFQPAGDALPAPQDAIVSAQDALQTDFPQKRFDDQPRIAPADSTVSSTTDDQPACAMTSSGGVPGDSPASSCELRSPLARDPPATPGGGAGKSPSPQASKPAQRESPGGGQVSTSGGKTSPGGTPGKRGRRGSRAAGGRGSSGKSPSSKAAQYSSAGGSKTPSGGKSANPNIQQLVEQKVKISKLMTKYLDAVKKEQEYFILSQLGSLATNDLVDGLCRQKLENGMAATEDHVERQLLKKEAMESENATAEVEDLMDHVIKYAIAAEDDAQRHLAEYKNKVGLIVEPVIKDMRENMQLRKDVDNEKSPLHTCAPALELLMMKMELVERKRTCLGPLYACLQGDLCQNYIVKSVEGKNVDTIRVAAQQVKTHAADQLKAEGLKTYFTENMAADRETLFRRVGFYIEEVCIAIVRNKMAAVKADAPEKLDNVEMKGQVRTAGAGLPYSTLVPNFSVFYSAYSKAGTDRGRLAAVWPLVRVLRDQMLFPFLFELLPDLQAELNMGLPTPAGKQAPCAQMKTDPDGGASLRIDDMRWQLPESKSPNYRQRQCLELATHWHAVRSELDFLLEVLGEVHKADPAFVKEMESVRSAFHVWMLKKKLCYCISSSCEALIGMSGSHFDWQYLYLPHAPCKALTLDQWAIELAKVILVELLIDLLITGSRNQVWKDGSMKFMSDHAGIIRLFIDTITDAQTSVYGYTRVEVAEREPRMLHEVRLAMIRHVGQKLPSLKGALDTASFLGIDTSNEQTPVGMMQAQQKLYMLKTGFGHAIFQDITGQYSPMGAFDFGLTDGNNLDDSVSVLTGRLFGIRAAWEWVTSLCQQVDARVEVLAQLGATLRAHCTRMPIVIAADALRYVLSKNCFDKQDFHLVQEFVLLATQTADPLTGKITADDIYRTVLKYRDLADCEHPDCCQLAAVNLQDLILRARPHAACSKRNVLRSFLTDVLRQPLSTKPVATLQESLNNVEKKASLDEFVNVQRILLCLERKDPFEDFRSHMVPNLAVPAVVGMSPPVVMLSNTPAPSSSGYSHGNRAVLPTPPPAHQNPTYAPLSALLADTKPSIMNLDTGLYSSAGRSYRPPSTPSSAAYSAGSATYSAGSYMKRDAAPQEYDSYKRARSDVTPPQSAASPYSAAGGGSSYSGRAPVLGDLSSVSEQSLSDTLSSALSSTVYPLPAHVSNVFRHPFNPPYM